MLEGLLTKRNIQIAAGVAGVVVGGVVGAKSVKSKKETGSFKFWKKVEEKEVAVDIEVEDVVDVEVEVVDQDDEIERDKETSRNLLNSMTEETIRSQYIEMMKEEPKDGMSKEEMIDALIDGIFSSKAQ